MDLAATHCADVLVLKPLGRINHLNSAAFEQALAPHLAECKASGVKLLFDLAGLEYVSSAGLRVFMLASKQLLPAGCKLAVAAPQPVVREIFEISRFNLLFPIYADIPSALAGLSPAAASAPPP